MPTSQSLAAFYQEELQCVPSALASSLGHFNVFDVAAFAGKYARPVHYTRREYFKISLLTGRKTLTYADKVIAIERHALIFFNPFIFYTWELLEEEQAGFFCLFTPAFFTQFGRLTRYPVFQPGQVPVFPLAEAQHQTLEAIFRDMGARGQWRENQPDSAHILQKDLIPAD